MPAIDLTAAVQAAGRQLGALQMTSIRGEADRDDQKNVSADLDAVARIFDQVILEIGRYAKSTLGVSEADVKAHFTNVVSDALQGNATFVLEEAGREIEEAREDTIAEVKREFERA